MAAGIAPTLLRPYPCGGRQTKPGTTRSACPRAAGRLLAEHGPQRPGVADGVGVAIVVEVREYLGPLALPLTDAIRPPGQAVVAIGAGVELAVVRAVQPDVSERRGHPQDARKLGAAHYAIRRAVSRE